METRQSSDFFINTAAEMDALERAAADGKHGRHYQADEQMAMVQHHIPGASHHVQLSLSHEEEMDGLTVRALREFIKAQDADAALALLYITRVLAPPLITPTAQLGHGIIDFDDVLSKIGWTPRSTAERREMHRRLYQFVVFGERAQVVGKRRGGYRDKATGKFVDTEISAPLWRIHATERPEQISLFPAQEVPVRVELVMSRAWTDLLTSSRTAQFLPMGEVLGAIPGNQPSGAWAKVIGLALASLWRRNPCESLSQNLRPTRRELLERYPPKTGPATQVLESKNPRRALEHWCNALQILVKLGFVAPSGEALVPYIKMRAALPSRDWGNEWLDQRVDIEPGSLIRSHVEERSLALSTIEPEKKRGRSPRTKQRF